MLPVEREAVVEFLRCLADVTNRDGGLFVTTARVLDTEDRIVELARDAWNETLTALPVYDEDHGIPEDEWREYYRDRALNAALLVEEGEI